MLFTWTPDEANCIGMHSVFPITKQQEQLTGSAMEDI